jgi:hypothetical protein
MTVDDYEKLNQNHVKMLFQSLFLTQHSPEEVQDAGPQTKQA